MSGQSSASRGGGLSVGVIVLLLILFCGATAVIAYLYLNSNRESTPAVLPTSAAVAVLPTTEPTTNLIATNTPIPTQDREAIATVDNSTALAATAVAQATQTREAEIFLTQTRPFIPTNTPRPRNTSSSGGSGGSGLATNTPIVIIVTPANTPIPTQVPPSDWQGEYFANPTLSGTAVFVRSDPQINFAWGTGSPGEGLPNDNFSVRWTKTVAMSPGTNRFYVRADDGVRVWLNNQMIIDRWQSATDQTYSTDATISQVNNSLRVEYFEGAGDAQIQFWWERVGDFTHWRGEYFTNKTLSESGLILTRNDTAVDFQWGNGAPANGLPVDNFSARWTRTITFEQNRYRFFATVDDGVRIYIDGRLILDDWQDKSVRTVSAATNLSGTAHIVVIEYYENVSDAQIRVWWEVDQPTATPTVMPTATTAAYP